MKRAILTLAIMLCSAVLLCGEDKGLTNRKPGFLAIYQVAVLDPYRSHLINCPSQNPSCNDIYNLEERHKWFYTIDDAVNWLNGKPYDACHLKEADKQAGIVCVPGSLWVYIKDDDAPTLEHFFGLYRVSVVKLRQVKTGEREEEEMQPVKVKRDKKEWRLAE